MKSGLKIYQFVIFNRNYVLNRDRNTQIIQQAQELNSLLLANNIRPVFLKGTGNLLEGLYEDVGERMVGDIDFLFSEEDFFKAIDILKKDNYSKSESELDYFQGFRHYSRLVKPANIAAVEIHKEVTIERYRGEFNYEMISKDTQLINDFLIMSFEKTTDCSRYLLDNPQYKVAGIVNNIILRSNKNVQFWI
ncbi:nucleotidyltransferase family protein [Flavobacteriaceae bacterium]|nr:nucleotidyltransferase family protein [Flavobacteriaceae bacterium]